MAIQYTTISEPDLGGGIDARSAENRIQPGFLYDLLNGDTLEARVLKRVGHQRHSGNLPVRINSVEFDVSGEITFVLDSAVDLLSVRSTPVVVYGRLGDTVAGSPIGTTDDSFYYPEFVVDPRIPMPDTGSTISVPAEDHQQTTANLFVGTVESTSTVDLSHSTFIPDSLEIDATTYEVTMGYDQSEDAGKEAILYYLANDPVIGTSHVVDSSNALTYDTIDTSGGNLVLEIEAGTHQLNNFQIIPAFYEVSGGSYFRVIPESMTIETTGVNAGRVTITFLSQSNPVVVLLRSPTADQIISGQVAAKSTGTVSLSPVTDETQKFPFIASYLIDPVTDQAELVIANTVTYDDDITDLDEVRDLTVEFDNEYTELRNFEIYYEWGSVVTNRLVVEDASSTASGTSDESPQLTLWGLDHSEIYGGSTSEREGWVTHLDSYRRSAERRLVAGLGGNLFTSRTYSEVADQYRLPLYYPRLRTRCDTDTVIAPLFHETGDTPGRSRGYLTANEGGSNWLEVTDVAYQTVSGRVRYTLAATAAAIYDVDGNPLVGTDLVALGLISQDDQVEIQQTGAARHNGIFSIYSLEIASSGNELYLEVENSAVDSTDWDETDVGGLAGIFTDRIPINSLSEFLPGDVLDSGAFGDADNYTVVSTSEDQAVLVDGAVTVASIASGVRINASRTSRVMPLRVVTGAAESENILRGDMLVYPGISRQYRVVGVHPGADIEVVSVTGDGTSATVVLTGADTRPFRVGEQLLLLRCGEYTGLSTITQISNETTLVVSHTGTTTVNPTEGVVAGHYIELDESANWIDSRASDTYVQVHSRWIPVEAPGSSLYDLPQNNYTYHLDSADYVNQSYLRSVMAQDNMYFTNGADEVMKFDGRNIYRAGLFRWQPGLFVNVDSTATGKISLDTPSITVVGGDAATGRFEVAEGEGSAFSVGETIVHSADRASYRIIDILTATGSNDVIIVSGGSISGDVSGGTLTSSTFYGYYFRLNAVDANSNIIASAVTGASDFVVELGESAAVTIRLLGMPVFGNYDYDSLELQIYRTQGAATRSTLGVYYQIATLPINFSNGLGYIDYTDTAPDDILTTLDPLSSLTAGELGVTHSEPIRAKYITSADNRLILANLKDYPELDIQVEDSTGVTLSNYTGLEFLLRRDNSDTDTVTDMVNRATYETRGTASGQTVFSGILGETDKFTVLKTGLGVSVGDWVYLYHNEDRNYGTANLTNGGPNLNVDVGASTALATGDLVKFTGDLTGTGLIVNKIYELGTEIISGFQFELIDPDVPGVPLTFSGAGSGVEMQYAGPRDLTFTGWWQVSELDGSGRPVISLPGMVATPIAGSNPDRILLASTSGNIPVLLGGDGNRQTVLGNQTTSPRTQLASRLAEAINASMRMADVTISGQESFIPWIIANSGGEYRAGQLILRQPRVAPETAEIVLPNAYNGFRIAVNDIFRDAGTSVSAREKVFPSRIIQSYQNFPELFDAPAAASQLDSDSVVDVNSSDGQELTGVITFFGESVTSAAQKEGIVVAPKENSIYVYSTSSRQPQRLETQGIGCTAPYSLAPTNQGIAFASDAGIYRIDRSFRLVYLGKRMERRWESSVNRERLDLAVGHHYSLGRQYKLSVPIGSESSANSEVYVYDHTREVEQGREGAWSRYDSHPATGWANLDRDAYFSSTAGKVFSLRRAGDVTDYRDDDQPINFVAELRANDFGDASIRKVVSKVTTHLRAAEFTQGTRLATAVNMSQEYDENDYLITERDDTLDGLSDRANQYVVTLQSSVDRKKGTHFQVRYTNSELDEPVEIAGVDYRVGGLGEEGVLQSQTTEIRSGPAGRSGSGN